MDILQLRYFLEVARTENITKAAERIRVAQPALSQTISKLENELDVKLFDRVGRSIRLNKNGKLLMQRSQEALLILDNVKREVKELDPASPRNIRLQVMAGSSILPGLLSGFRSEHPAIQFQLVQLRPDNEYDLCITTSVNGIIPDSSRLLLEEEILLALPADHPLAKTKAIALADVRDIPFLSLDQNKPLRQTMDIFCHAAGFTPEIVLETDNPATLRGMIAAGLGIAFIPAVTWPEIREAASVVSLHITKPHCQRKLYITWEQERYLTRDELVFLDYAQMYFQKLTEKGKS